MKIEDHEKLCKKVKKGLSGAAARTGELRKNRIIKILKKNIEEID